MFVARDFGVELEEFEASSDRRCAFSMISSCLVLSFASIGTKSLGTGVRSLKFLENFIRSLSLIALSCEAWLRRRSSTRIFSVLANCLNESRTSVSTFEVAFSGGPTLRFGEADTLGPRFRLRFGLFFSVSAPLLMEGVGFDVGTGATGGCFAGSPALDCAAFSG